MSNEYTSNNQHQNIYNGYGPMSLIEKGKSNNTLILVAIVSTAVLVVLVLAVVVGVSSSCWCCSL